MLNFQGKTSDLAEYFRAIYCQTTVFDHEHTSWFGANLVI